ncbi:GPI-anchored wall transfer protein [Ophiocordyceps sinensis CO18]|uniref:GPI-anchored wall transfer protein n=1 Tax=Ophiocordyceps sinensis (strain Co18 / CGMCC 3.14243) TaxID=911162 RepID=T5ALS3_OPHSC|nr:GPI-anchored wall transfer protein [Ophiocordyceps sinensis CO18]
MSNTTSYKQQKEDFVSNLSGGSVTEIGLIAVLLWSILQARQSLFLPNTALSIAVDYALNVGAILLATTLYSSTPLLLSVLVVAPVALVYLLPPNAAPRRRKPKVPPAADSKSGPDGLRVLPVKPFLTTYRGCMMVITCVAILAVDFRLFPRRFAKVETWGTSLMDVGVGSFVFAGGLFAARPVLVERMSGRTTPLLHRLVYSARHSVPLLVLGIVRLLSVKGLDYAEHVTEYGVHWNFFFTLGLLPPFTATCQAALSIVPSYAALSLLIGGIYQLLLDKTELRAFILAAPRTDLLSMNREGVFSFFGYLAIFLAGQHLGLLIIPRSVNARARPGVGTAHNTLLLYMAAWAGIWSGLYWLSTSYTYGLGLDVSRRLANLPYVLWVTAFNSLQILAFCCIDTVFFPAFYSAATQKAEREAYDKATSRVLRAYNRNGLAMFLVANLLTGLVNMTVRTLDASAVTTMGILLAYTGAVTGLALVLDAHNISIKL